MAGRSFGLLKHVEKKTELAKKAQLVKTAGGSMLQSKISNGWIEEQDLEKSIDIAVHNMVCQARILRLVEEPVQD